MIINKHEQNIYTHNSCPFTVWSAWLAAASVWHNAFQYKCPAKVNNTVWNVLPILSCQWQKQKCHALLAATVEEEGAHFWGEITSSDKVKNISITKQRRWCYYMVMESKECWQVELSTHLSLQRLIMTVKCGRKVQAGSMSPIPQYKRAWWVSGVSIIYSL